MNILDDMGVSKLSGIFFFKVNYSFNTYSANENKWLMNKWFMQLVSLPNIRKTAYKHT